MRKLFLLTKCEAFCYHAPMTPLEKKKFLLYTRSPRLAYAGGRAAINRKFSRQLLEKLDRGLLAKKEGTNGIH